MAVTFVGANTYTPTSSLTTRTINVPAGVADGDVIIVGVTKGGGTAGATMSGLTATSTAIEQLQSGQAIDVWFKENAVAADAGTTITINTTVAARVGIIVAVYRGLATSGALDVFAVQTSASGTSVTAPNATASASDVRIDFAFGSANAGNITYTVPAGMTARAAVSGTTTAGEQNAVLADNLTPISPGASGANVYTASSSVIGVGVTLLFKVKAASATAQPISQVSNAGSWVVVGGATSYGVLADGSDSTYIETPTNPTAASIELGFDTLASGQVTVTARARYASGGSGSVTVKLRQSTTTIATWTQPVTSAFTTYSFTTTSAQTATITDYALLRATLEGTAA